MLFAASARRRFSRAWRLSLTQIRGCLFMGAQFSHSDPCNVLSNTLQELAPREGSVFFKMGRVHRRLNQVRCSSSERHSQILCNVSFPVERGFVLISKRRHQLRRHSIRSLSQADEAAAAFTSHVFSFSQ